MRRGPRSESLRSQQRESATPYQAPSVGPEAAVSAFDRPRSIAVVSVKDPAEHAEQMVNALRGTGNAIVFLRASLAHLERTGEGR